MSRVEYLEHFKRQYNKEKEVIKNETNHRLRVAREGIERHQANIYKSDDDRIMEELG